jgi:hypothetical protein
VDTLARAIDNSDEGLTPVPDILRFRVRVYKGRELFADVYPGPGGKRYVVLWQTLKEAKAWNDQLEAYLEAYGIGDTVISLVSTTTAIYAKDDTMKQLGVLGALGSIGEAVYLWNKRIDLRDAQGCVGDAENYAREDLGIKSWENRQEHRLGYVLQSSSGSNFLGCLYAETGSMVSMRGRT